MQVSVVIPVWNGEKIVDECLRALTTNPPDQLAEVLCVDNASPDDSARRIAETFPGVTLIRQPVNLGFAGGVNIGLRAATGDLLVLLNQDCLVRPGWLDALVDAFQRYPDCGIAGCTIFNANGTVNHAGARMERPAAYGVHLTGVADDVADDVVEADYVTGALFAIRRATWEAIGAFDEDYYPAYYEESDYCYRARRHGFEVRYVPDAEAEHLFTGSDWKANPIRHAANQHQSRYRFICKHFASDELTPFFTAEKTAIDFMARTGLDYPSYFQRHHADIADRVSFLGWVTDEQQDELYQSCDLFVAPSLYESFGLVYVEAMNYAKPVIGKMLADEPGLTPIRLFLWSSVS